ncbi:AI-2E family transporter [Bacillus massiliigorillae]|uniref:AI-2E family transporter n=1 Tax=Bacillus massiliigorillae TaxID=1243664 RepID=UPI0012B54599|nr:AI-2E family transporter [Bacillus massiliigorillae]
MSEFTAFLRTKTFSRIITILVLILFLYSIGNLINLVLFTFIFAFLMGRLQQFISHKLDKLIHINPKVILVIIYCAIVSALGLVMYKYLPVITIQITELITQIMHFFRNPPDDEIIKFLISTANTLPLNIESNINKIYFYASGVGSLLVQVLLAIVLSLFLLLEKGKIISFTSRFKKGNFGQFFINIEHFGKKFINSFGKVIEVQFLIALTNAILSTFVLWLIGFPQLIGLFIMIFSLGLIPVAGVIISLIPLCMIAYNVGGFTTIIIVIIMIFVLHALEAYILNPKFMSVKTNLPTFFTLAVLLFAEHFFGVWGLIIGIPVFIFMIDMLEIPEENEESKKTITK